MNLGCNEFASNQHGNLTPLILSPLDVVESCTSIVIINGTTRCSLDIIRRDACWIVVRCDHRRWAESSLYEAWGVRYLTVFTWTGNHILSCGHSWPVLGNANEYTHVCEEGGLLCTVRRGSTRLADLFVLFAKILCDPWDKRNVQVSLVVVTSRRRNRQKAKEKLRKLTIRVRHVLETRSLTVTWVNRALLEGRYGGVTRQW